ncbi:hypothetical protein RIF29_14287 [Crotalaria pallida]|uniref:Uncharacterized protein n=1 Tax=Crotalaria pallida TaxID=3830 RepID=A0AAN9FH98_CROPI
MRPPSNSTISSVSRGAVFRNLSSPIPYLFGGLALMLGLISIALLILACSYRKHYSSSSTSAAGNEEEKPTNMMVDTKVNSEPKIVVIMAGENNPTYLAKPVSSTSYAERPV